MVSVLLAGIVAALALAVVPSAAWAHATLVDSSPRDGQRLSTLPNEVVFTFDEVMSPPAFVVVTASDGTPVTVGRPSLDGPMLRQRLSGRGSAGDYTMAYRVVSADGHPVTGEIAFEVGATMADGSSRAGTSGVPSPLGDHQVAVILTIGFLLLVGGLHTVSARRSGR